MMKKGIFWMTTQPVNITVFFDFLCPYTYRTMQWVDNVKQQLGDGMEVQWKYFSLEQQNTDTPERKLWEQPDDYEPMIPGRGPKSRALLAFWGVEAARQQGDEAFNRMRMALSHARHCDRMDFSQRANVEALAEQVELDMEQFRRDFNDRSLLDVIRRDHQEAIEKYEAFGVPTIAFDELNAVYIKMMKVPSLEDTVAFLNHLRGCWAEREWLAELKRPNPCALG
jgi:predicted DsbA family dithiol-disulfide isomerase